MRRIFLKATVSIIAFGIGIFSSPTSIRSHKNENNPQKETVSYVSITNTPFPQNSFEAPKPIGPASENYERRTPVCTNKKILPIWRLLKKDNEFRERVGYSSDSADCSKMLEMKYVDLNGDGVPEILVRGKNFQLCGAVGNCGFWIVSKRGRAATILLSSSDYVDRSKMGEQILKSRASGYLNIVLKGHMDAGNTDFEYFRFNGVRYTSYRCMVEAYVPGSSPNPKWEFISCKEYDRRQKD